MLGVCTAVSATTSKSHQTNSFLPVAHRLSETETTTSYNVKTAANTFEPVEYHLKIEPGLSGIITDFETEVLAGASASAGMTETSEFARWGLVTSQADTNPHILVKKDDVRRRKVDSKEG